jgi:hypothetical protein
VFVTLITSVIGSFGGVQAVRGNAQAKIISSRFFIEIMAEPTSKLSKIIAKHSEWEKYHERWELCRKMVSGGSAMDRDARAKLLTNPNGRPSAVIEERLNLSVYTNVSAVPIKRLVSQLFAKDASYSAKKANGKSGSKANIKDWDTFLASGSIIPGDDDGRTSFLSLLRNACTELVVTGKAIAVLDSKAVDTTGLSDDVISKMDLNTPSVSLVPRENLWDWGIDPNGKGFSFAKICFPVSNRSAWDDDNGTAYNIFIYERVDNRILFSQYQITPANKKNTFFDVHTATENNAILTPKFEKKELFSYQNNFVFPVFTVSVPSEFWIADQIFDQQKWQFNLETSIAYSIQNNLFQVPVFIRGDDKSYATDDGGDDPLSQQKLGEGYYIVLPKGTQITSLQTGGHFINTAVDIINRVIQKNILSVLQQMALAAGDTPSAISRSAVSKQEDRRPEALLMEYFGELFRIFAKQILDGAAIVKGELLDWEVQGFNDFLQEGLLEYLSGVTNLAQQQIPSGVFAKAVIKSVIKKAASTYDIDDSLLPQIFKEIDDNEKIQMLPIIGITPSLVDDGTSADDIAALLGGGDSATPPNEGTPDQVPPDQASPDQMSPDQASPN